VEVQTEWRMTQALATPEIRIERVPVNDLSFHIAASQRLAQSLVTGDSFLDPWMPLWALGYPLWHFYQPIPHMVAGLWLAMASHFASAPAAFAVFYYLLLVAVPASTYIGARLFGLEPLAAGFAAILIIAVSEAGDFSGSVATLKTVTDDVPRGAGRRGLRQADRTACR
jgi:hypothetical protein